jgi:hypothetical protein
MVPSVEALHRDLHERLRAGGCFHIRDAIGDMAVRVVGRLKKSHPVARKFWTIQRQSLWFQILITLEKHLDSHVRPYFWDVDYLWHPPQPADHGSHQRDPCGIGWMELTCEHAAACVRGSPLYGTVPRLEAVLGKFEAAVRKIRLLLPGQPVRS